MLAYHPLALVLSLLLAPLIARALPGTDATDDMPGAMVALYSKTGCHDEDHFLTVRVWDNSCMDWAKPGWSSYKLLQQGSDVNFITAYSKNMCLPNQGMKNGCIDARFVNQCVDSHDEDGAANALGSLMWPQCKH